MGGIPMGLMALRRMRSGRLGRGEESDPAIWV